MKTLFVAIALFCTLSASAEITVTKVGFGSKSQGCSGRGICKVQSQEAGAVPATLELGEGGSTLSVTIIRTAVGGTDEEIVADLLAGSFVQSEDLLLSERFSERLGATGRLTLLQGTHSVTVTDVAYVIHLAVSTEGIE